MLGPTQSRYRITLPTCIQTQKAHTNTQYAQKHIDSPHKAHAKHTHTHTQSPDLQIGHTLTRTHTFTPHTSTHTRSTLMHLHKEKHGQETHTRDTTHTREEHVTQYLSSSTMYTSCHTSSTSANHASCNQSIARLDEEKAYSIDMQIAMYTF